MYKVKYQKVAIMEDGTHGNVSMGKDIAYTSHNIQDIPSAIANHLRDVKKYPVITNIEFIEGHLIDEN